MPRAPTIVKVLRNRARSQPLPLRSFLLQFHKWPLGSSSNHRHATFWRVATNKFYVSLGLFHAPKEDKRPFWVELPACPVWPLVPPHPLARCYNNLSAANRWRPQLRSLWNMLGLLHRCPVSPCMQQTRDAPQIISNNVNLCCWMGKRALCSCIVFI